jgi:NAD(P)-dependent dehydrogenase (short-subunit alcohol dehydrogenase family)
MTRTQSALAVSGLILGASIVARQIRSRRAVDLAGRVVLITGGSRGLGLLMAREVGRLGAQIVIAARDEDELLRAQRDLLAHDIDSSILVADVATEAQAQRMIAQVIERHGRLDVLINNAV